MKYLINLALLAALYFCQPFALIGQTALTGTINDQDGMLLPFVNILLLNPVDSSLVRGAITDEKGQFRIEVTENTELILRFSFVGYNDAYRSVNTSTPGVDLGLITLIEVPQEMEGVEIVRSRPLFEQRVDCTVINVDESITTSSGSALDILEKSPGVTVDRMNSSIAMAGKQGVRIMINGKISQMPMAAVTQLLNGMNAESVESVELITTPPSRYEADGDAGIINIVLKQSVESGTNGSLSLFAGYGLREKAGGSFNFNHRNGNMNLYGNYSLRYNSTEQIVSNYRRMISASGGYEVTDTRSYRYPQTEAHNGSFGADYRIGQGTILGASTTIFDSRWEMDAHNDANVSVNSIPSHTITLKNDELNHITYYVGSLNISQKLGGSSNILADLSYIQYRSNNPTAYIQSSQFFNGNNSLDTNGQLKSDKVTPLKTWVPSLDYSLTLNEGFTLEAGLKGAFNALQNDVTVHSRINGAEEWAVDQNLTQKIFLYEDVLSAYSSIAYKLNETVDIMAGLRYEYTFTDLNRESGQRVLTREFGNLFPSLFYSKRFDSYTSAVLSYSRRISRPTFNDIAPFVIFLDPNTFWTGNESLRPSITDAFKAELRLNTFLFALQYSHDEDAIVRFQPRIADDGITQLITVENFDSRHTLSVNAALPFRIAQWWNMRFNIAGSYAINKTKQLGNSLRFDLFNGSINGQMHFVLPRNYSIEFTGMYRTPIYLGISRVESDGMLNIGAEKKLPNNNGSIKLSVSDLLNSLGRNSSTLVPERNLDVRTNFVLEGRIVTLTYTLSLGNRDLQRMRAARSASEEEQIRVQ